MLLVFATAAVLGNFGGRDAATSLCRESPPRLCLQPAEALVSYANDPANAVLAPPAGLPVVAAASNITLAANWSAFWAQGPAATWDEAGVAYTAYVWTGSYADGSVHPRRCGERTRSPMQS